MRNISFNESTVLQEFSKIAMKKGLIKTAGIASDFLKKLDDKRTELLKGGKEFETILPTLKTFIEKELSIFKKKYPTAPADQVKNLEEQARKLLVKEIEMTADDKNTITFPEETIIGEKPILEVGAPINQDVQRLHDKYRIIRENKNENFATSKLKFNSEIAKFKEKYKNHPAVKYYEGILSKIPDEFEKLLHVEKNITSSSNLYDVLKETGKDLIDSAHPDGSAKITGVKTDDVIETVLDQQEKDLEMVMKDPTGKYAKLIKQYTQLKNAGATKEELLIVKDAINSIASSEEVVKYTLITLADQLDSLGLKSYADGIDEILKKKVLASKEDGVAYLNFLINEFEKNNSTYARVLADELRNIINSNKVFSLFDTINKVDELMNREKNSKLFDGSFLVAVQLAKSKFNEALIKERSEKKTASKKVLASKEDAKLYADFIINKLKAMDSNEAKQISIELKHFNETNSFKSLSDAQKIINQIINISKDSDEYLALRSILTEANQRFNDALLNEKISDDTSVISHIPSPAAGTSYSTPKKKSKLPAKDVVDFKNKYYEFLLLSNPEKAKNYLPTIPWGVQKFNSAWKEVGKIEGITKLLEEEKSKKIKEKNDTLSPKETLKSTPVTTLSPAYIPTETLKSVPTSTTTTTTLSPAYIPTGTLKSTPVTTLSPAYIPTGTLKSK